MGKSWFEPGYSFVVNAIVGDSAGGAGSNTRSVCIPGPFSSDEEIDRDPNHSLQVGGVRAPAGVTGNNRYPINMKGSYVPYHLPRVTWSCVSAVLGSNPEVQISRNSGNNALNAETTTGTEVTSTGNSAGVWDAETGLTAQTAPNYIYNLSSENQDEVGILASVGGTDDINEIAGDVVRCLKDPASTDLLRSSMTTGQYCTMLLNGRRTNGSGGTIRLKKAPFALTILQVIFYHSGSTAGNAFKVRNNTQNVDITSAVSLGSGAFEYSVQEGLDLSNFNVAEGDDLELNISTYSGGVTDPGAVIIYRIDDFGLDPCQWFHADADVVMKVDWKDNGLSVSSNRSSQDNTKEFFSRRSGPVAGGLISLPLPPVDTFASGDVGNAIPCPFDIEPIGLLVSHADSSTTATANLKAGGSTVFGTNVTLASGGIGQLARAYGGGTPSVTSIPRGTLLEGTLPSGGVYTLVTFQLFGRVVGHISPDALKHLKR